MYWSGGGIGGVGVGRGDGAGGGRDCGGYVAVGVECSHQWCLVVRRALGWLLCLLCCWRCEAWRR